MYFKHRYYSQDLGRFHSRDPLAGSAEVGSAYEYTKGQPTKMIDPQGLIAVQPTTCQSKDCCCCAERMTIDLAKQHEEPDKFVGTKYGHYFRVFTLMTPKEWDVDYQGQCRYEWWEQSNLANNPYLSVPAYKWVEPEKVGAEPISRTWLDFKCDSLIFGGTDTDFPYITLPMAGTRVLRFKILLYSTEGCDCKKPWIKVTAMQIINGADVKNRTFYVPDPADYNGPH